MWGQEHGVRVAVVAPGMPFETALTGLTAIAQATVEGIC